MGVIKEREIKYNNDVLKELLLMSPNGTYMYALINGDVKDAYRAYMDGDMEVVDETIMIFWLPFEYQNDDYSNLVYFEDEDDYNNLIVEIIDYLLQKKIK